MPVIKRVAKQRRQPIDADTVHTLLEGPRGASIDADRRDELRELWREHRRALTEAYGFFYPGQQPWGACEFERKGRYAPILKISLAGNERYMHSEDFAAIAARLQIGPT